MTATAVESARSQRGTTLIDLSLEITNQMPANPPPSSLGCVKYSELFDPAASGFRRVADMSWFREYHAVTVLVPPGGTVVGDAHLPERVLGAQGPLCQLL